MMSKFNESFAWTHLYNSMFVVNATMMMTIESYVKRDLDRNSKAIASFFCPQISGVSVRVASAIFSLFPFTYMKRTS